MKLPFGLSGLRLSRPPLWRMLLLAIGSWLLLTALFLPWLNPLMRFGLADDAETGALMGMVRFQIAETKERAESHLRREGAWPQTPREMYQIEDNGLLEFAIPGPNLIEIRFGGGFPTASGLRGSALLLQREASGRWQCRPGTPPPPSRWQFDDCREATSSTTPTWLFAALLLAVLALIALLLWLQLLDPRLRGLQRAPKRLRRQPLAGLRGLDWRLRLLRRREASLSAAGISAADWQEALRWPQATAEQKVAGLALRIGARSAPSAGWSLPGEVFEWQLPNTLPLALDRVLVHLPPSELAAATLLRHLRSHSTGQDVLLILSPGAAFDASLLAWASDPANLCVAVDQASLSEWLLHPQPIEVLVGMAARQLRITRISPYQTRGGVTRPAAFFGREKLLARVLNREPGNYLLVGGRQLGKTSLMKAIERRFEAHPRVQCLYLSLRDHRLAPRLAHALSESSAGTLEDLLRALAARAGERRLLLLIDEADLFLREEARSGYAQLSSLRALSEEGLCHFMLAGFWDLYEATALDFASPIRNFGEVIRLGALEPEACTALATEPLQRLGIRYAAEHLVAQITDACGQRANLVAIVCQQLLEQLERGERVISVAAVEQALASEAVADALAGWSRLSPEPQACALDRALVYRIAQLQLRNEPGLSLPAWLQQLEDAAVRSPAEAVRRSFARLQLAYVVLREEPGDGWRFAVPLLAAQFRGEEVDALLARELRELAAISL